MNIMMYQIVSGDWLFASEDGAPLIRVQLCNEVAELDLEEQLELMYEFKLSVMAALGKKHAGGS